MNNQAQTKTELIERAIDKSVTGGIAIQGSGGAMTVQPQNMTEVLEFAKMMSTAGNMIRAAFRNNPGSCLALTLQALRWGMDPFAVANKAYLVPGKDKELQVSYEAQLVQAVITERAPLQKRLRTTYEGEGPTRKCIVTGYLKGEDEPFIYESPMVKDIGVKNSPLWTADPDQQLSYYSVRSWARRHVPEVLLGVYTPDEIESQEQFRGPDHAKLVGGERPSLQGPSENDAPVEVERDLASEPWEMYAATGEEIGKYPPADWIEVFFDVIDTDDVLIPDFIRNNIETALTIGANELVEDVTSRGILVRLSNEGWPPERYKEVQEADEDEGAPIVPDDEADAIVDEGDQAEAKVEPGATLQGPTQPEPEPEDEPEAWVAIAAEARQAFSNAKSVAGMDGLGPLYHGQLVEADIPTGEMATLNGEFAQRKLELQRAGKLVDPE